MLDELESDLSFVKVGCHHHANELANCEIHKATDKTYSSVHSSAVVSTKEAWVCRCDPILEKMEAALSGWMGQQYRKKSDVSYPFVCVKTLLLYPVTAKREVSNTTTPSVSTTGPSTSDTRPTISDHSATRASISPPISNHSATGTSTLDSRPTTAAMVPLIATSKG